MSIRVSNIRLGIDESEHALPERVARALGVRVGDIRSWRILRKSLDSRNKSDLRFVYSAEIALPEDESRLIARARAARSGVEAELYRETPFELPPPGEGRLDERPVIVGSGPAGLFAAYFLAAAGYRPLVLERGRAVRDRVRDVQAFDAGGPLDVESNYLFGEGGAGTFSDGKLTCRNSGPDVQRVLQIFSECKGKPSILYDHRPHLGSNRLPAVVKALRQRIEGAGGELRFSCRVEDVDIDDRRVRAVMTSSGRIPCSLLLLAIGHSARDTYEMLLRRGVPMVQKPFQIGVRIEQSQEQVNRAQYGEARLEAQLGAADYTLIARGDVPLFSFCMCAGGQVIPSVSEPGYFCTNGMSLSKRSSPYANSGLMVTLDPSDFGSTDVLAGMELQRVYERMAYEAGRGDYVCPIQWAGDFLAGRASHGPIPSSYPRQTAPLDITRFVPPKIVRALRRGLPILDHRWRGRFLAGATLVA
ncbi:MAG TPA: NAD(P)-binding protein, partial [Pirellulales bacterium]